MGDPVVFFWYNSRFSVGQWAAIRAAVDPNHTSIWIGEGTDAEYLRVFDGHHLYSITWTDDPQSMLITWGQRVRAKAAELGGQRYWVGTAMPGWNDLALGRGNSYVRPRDGGSYFRSSFAGVAKSGADWAIITSFNEWPEGTMIEPSASYGDTYLNLARELAAAYRAGDPGSAASVRRPWPLAPRRPRRSAHRHAHQNGHARRATQRPTRDSNGHAKCHAHRDADRDAHEPTGARQHRHAGRTAAETAPAHPR